MDDMIKVQTLVILILQLAVVLRLI